MSEGKSDQPSGEPGSEACVEEGSGGSGRDSRRSLASYLSESHQKGGQGGKRKRNINAVQNPL